MSVDVEKLRALLAARDEALSAYSYRDVLSRGVLADAHAELVDAAVNALPQLLAIVSAAVEYYDVCADVRCDSSDRGPALDRLFAALAAVDAARKAGT